MNQARLDGTTPLNDAVWASSGGTARDARVEKTLTGRVCPVQGTMAVMGKQIRTQNC